MKKIVVHRAGGYDELTIERSPSRALGPGEVRVAVKGVGVNYADCMVRMGLYASAKKYVGWPITPGFDFAGHVAEVADDVEGFEVGAPILGVTRFGAYATEVVAKSNWLFPLPEGMDLLEAAAYPTAHLTAWYALCELGHPRPGATILVHSAAGGVGSALVQIGKLLGCRVIAVVGRAQKVHVPQKLGADEVIDKSAKDLWLEARRLSPEGYQLILDANGVSTLGQSYAHLAPGGRLIVYGFHSLLERGKDRPSWPKLIAGVLRTPRFNPLSMTGDNKSVMAFNLSYLFDRVDIYRQAMTELLAWTAEGKLESPTITPYLFDEVAQAHAELESGESVGKLVLQVPA